MRLHRKTGCTLLFAGVLLLLYGCVRMDGETPPDTVPPESGVSIDASFSQEDGGALCESTVRFSTGEDSADYPLDDSGALVASGLPRSGNLTLTVLDRENQVQGAMDLTFSEGAVIDAATDDSGAGHITLKRDTDEIALAFLLKNDGSLLCALRLEPSRGS